MYTAELFNMATDPETSLTMSPSASRMMPTGA